MSSNFAICIKRITNLKVIKSYNPFSANFKKWNLAIRYYDPHFEKHPTYRKHILIPTDENVLIDESVHMMSFDCENEAVLKKNSMKIYCEKCSRYIPILGDCL